MWTLALAVILIAMQHGTVTLSGQTHCTTHPAPDGCNTCTTCDSGVTGVKTITVESCTAVYCVKQQDVKLKPDWQVRDENGDDWKLVKKCDDCTTGSNPNRVSLYAMKADYKIKPNGLMKIIPCDPPRPKDSSIGCTEPATSWGIECPETRGKLIAVFPPTNAFEDYGERKDHGIVYWCVYLDAN